MTLTIGVPGLFLSGQSNAGNQDATPGTIDARVSLTWSSMYAGTIDGPGPMRLQTAGVSTGHSFEWQCGADLAAFFKSNLITAKFWADGTIVQYFLRSWAIHWPTLSATIDNFALQWAAAGMVRVEFAWCQGESNCNSALPAELATFESDTSTLFDAIKALLATRGLGVHFTIIKTNINIQLTGGVTKQFLDAVRAAQEHLALSRTDTSIVSLDWLTTPGTLHYSGGQTNTGGSYLATSIESRYANYISNGDYVILATLAAQLALRPIWSPSTI